MHNELFSIGIFTVHMYGLMIAVGIIMAYVVAERRAKRQGLDYEKVFDLVLWCVISGFIGAKILYILTIFPQVIDNPKMILTTFGDGWVIYGGILFGILGAFLFCKKNKLPPLAYFDLGLPSVALAQGFGRIGCFFAGCCYGKETDLPIGITFRSSAFAPNGIALIPTQLISSALNFINFLILIRLNKKKKADGQVAAMYLILYSAGRFVIEFFRGDLERGSIGVLSTSQFIGIFTFAAGIILFILATRRGKIEGIQTAEERAAAAAGEHAPKDGKNGTSGDIDGTSGMKGAADKASDDGAGTNGAAGGTSAEKGAGVESDEDAMFRQALDELSSEEEAKHHGASVVAEDHASEPEDEISGQDTDGSEDKNTDGGASVKDAGETDFRETDNGKASGDVPEHKSENSKQGSDNDGTGGKNDFREV